MKKTALLIIIFGLALTACKQSANAKSELVNQEDSVVVTDNAVEKSEAQKLIREVLKWVDSDESIELLPVTSAKNDSIYTGFDKNKLQQNVAKLTNSGLFSKEFVENYNQIILTLDKKLRNNDYGSWYIGDLPPFEFASGVNPWCLCQDNMDWNLVEVEQLQENEFYWKWGGLKADTHPSWKDFKYKFKVTIEDSKYKISYLEGFDIE